MIWYLKKRKIKMRFDTDIDKMGMVGAADAVIVYSGQQPCLVKIVQQGNFDYDAYVQVIEEKYVYELLYTQMEYPVVPRLIAIGSVASKALGNNKHEIINIGL